MTKAYKDLEFINSPAARPLRMLSEYIEPRDRFDRLGIDRALIFWGSARLRPHAGDAVAETVDYYAEARDLAARMARWTMAEHAPTDRYVICSGGGPGIMEAANYGAADINADLSMGLGIDLPAEQGLNGGVSDALQLDFHYFFMRKFWFMNLAKALIVFPGGFGTLDELFEMLTLIQTNRQEAIPVVLFGSHFWRRLINFDVLLELGLIAPEDVDLFHVIDSVDEAEALLVERLDGH
ncbi:LOG family protein [Salinisphaera sp. USBA-960]|uniref:LOG family protein n=1 Tax=Salinisphaera orenii TaxID=856731 RepID=UPI000DBE58AE|nr:LOG family protein [Salifodinibacter halophilus]NNC26640.1 LOG family protein [Salifodinibacter halophilus]